MRASGAYVPVAHVAWSQTASSWGTRAGFPLQRLGVEVEGLSGTVFLEHGQFLHLGMTLNYAMAAPPRRPGGRPRARRSPSTRAAACASTTATTSITRPTG